ncbi:Triostin synthetase I [compost metagenome]
MERAAAYPVQDERLGEKVCLAVIVRAGQELPANDMLEHLAGCGLSKYDMPEYFLGLDSFPLTASGKILKRELVEMTLRGQLKPTAVRYRARAVAGA